MVEQARRTVFATIEARTGARGLRAAVTTEVVNTPQTWRDTFNLDKGAILVLSHSFFNVLSFRPSTRHPSIKGCYFVGASTHPGTGVPICLAGAKITATQVLEKDEETEKPVLFMLFLLPLFVLTLFLWIGGGLRESSSS